MLHDCSWKIDYGSFRTPYRLRMSAAKKVYHMVQRRALRRTLPHLNDDYYIDVAVDSGVADMPGKMHKLVCEPLDEIAWDKVAGGDCLRLRNVVI